MFIINLDTELSNYKYGSMSSTIIYGKYVTIYFHGFEPYNYKPIIYTILLPSNEVDRVILFYLKFEGD